MQDGQPSGWKFAVANGLMMVAVFVLVPMPEIAKYLLFVFAQINAVAATIQGVRWHRPDHLAPWAFFGSAAFLGLVAAVVYGWQTLVGSDWVYPTPADLLFLVMCLPIVAGLLAVVRARTPGHDLAALVDATLAALGVAMLAVVAIPDATAIGDLEPLRLVQPLIDVLLLGLVLRVALGGGRQLRSMKLAALAIASLVAADTFELAFRLQGGDPPQVTTIGLMLASVLWAVSALHPSMATITDRVDAVAANRTVSWGRYALLTAGVLLLPVLQATRPLHGRDLPDAALGWAAILMNVLVVVRLGLLIRDQRRASGLRAELDRRRAETRLGVILEHSSDIVVLIDADRRITYATPSLRRLLGLDPDGLVGRPLTDLMVDQRDRVSVQLERLVRVPLGATVPVDGDHVLNDVDGIPHRLQVVATNLLEHPDVGALVLTGRDVTDARELEEQLRRQALTDPLTGLANRTLFNDRTSHALAARRRTPGAQLAILFVDLDDFKTVNDSLGHDVGDQLLLTVADRLRACVRFEDTVARLGGDEFALLLPGTDPTFTAEQIADRVLTALADPIRVADRSVRISASIGIAATIADSFPTADELLRQADTAMYAVKAVGKGGRTHFASAMHDLALRRLDLIADLDVALAEGQFTLAYQPVVDIADHSRIVGAEALVRWDHPHNGRIPPDQFIALAEETGAIIPLGRWVLAEACAQLASWRARQPDHALTMAVNVSAQQLRHPGLVDDVAAALIGAGLPADALTLELTESVLVDDPQAAVATLSALRELGVRVAVDDFGTGYSSLSYLNQFPIDAIKIDKTFVDQLAGDHPQAGLTRGILSLAATLAVSTVAEGIETADQLEQLRAMECPFGQGYLFDRPLPPEEFTRRIATGSFDGPRPLAVPSRTA